MIRDSLTTRELADLVRKQTGDKSAPVIIYRGEHPSQWSLEMVTETGDFADDQAAQIKMVTETLRKQYDLR